MRGDLLVGRKELAAVDRIAAGAVQRAVGAAGDGAIAGRARDIHHGAVGGSADADDPGGGILLHQADLAAIDLGLQVRNAAGVGGQRAVDRAEGAADIIVGDVLDG